jgi:hypothetical protein
LVLDFPRNFKQEHVFAFRTLFWWGNFVSFTLHLKGKYLDSESIHQLLLNQETNNCFLSFEGDEWNHDLGSKDYINLNEIDLKNLDWTVIPFIKICFLMELNEINNLKQNYTKYSELLLAPFYGNKF